MTETIENNNNCRFCKSDNIHNMDSNFVKCNECDCIFNQNFNDGKKSLLDGDIESPSNSIFSTMSNPIKMRFWDLISKSCMKYLEEKTSMKFNSALDIGALYGHLVKRLNEYGIPTMGIEVEQNYIFNDVSGKIHSGYFDENFKSEKKYDLICMTQMIYYVKNPILVIKKASDLLSKRGIIFISTQNPNSSIILQKQFPIFENSMNILLSKKNFQSIALNLGLEIVDFTNFRPNIYLDRLKNSSLGSEFKNFFKYYKKSPYEKDSDGHHSFLLLRKR